MLVLKGLINYYKTDKKDFICSCLFMSVLVIFMYFGILLASLVEK